VIDSPMIAEGEAIFAITNEGIDDYKDWTIKQERIFI
jgi:hypothetical protein